MKQYKFLVLLILTALLSGCYSSSMMQSAKTLDKGEREVTASGSGYLGYINGFTTEWMWRQGIGDKSDFGAFYSLGFYGHARLDWKRELWSSASESMYLSSGALFDVFLPNDFSGDPFYFGLGLPLYYSFNHDKGIVPYVGQRLSFGLLDAGIFNHYNNDNPETGLRFNHQMYYSGAAGVRFEKLRIPWFVEFSYNIRISRVYSSYYSYDYNDPNDIGEWRLIKRYNEDPTVQLSVGIMVPVNKKKPR
jgi:hypothetical protein